METSKNGKNFILKREDFRSHPYLDIGGVPTIGFGNTYYPNGQRVSMQDDAITKERAHEIFLAHLEKLEVQLDKLLLMQLAQNEYDAIASFAYNVKFESFKTSTLLKKINSGQPKKDIAAEFLRWVYYTNNGFKLISNGLKNRRQKEYNLFLNGDYDV